MAVISSVLSGVFMHMFLPSQETYNLKQWDSGISSPHVARNEEQCASWPQTNSVSAEDGEECSGTVE